MKTDVMRACAISEEEAVHKIIETLYFIGVDIKTAKVLNVEKLEGKDSYNVTISYNAEEYNKQNKKERLQKEKEKLEGIKDYSRIINEMMGKEVQEEKERLEFRPKL